MDKKTLAALLLALRPPVTPQPTGNAVTDRHALLIALDRWHTQALAAIGVHAVAVAEAAAKAAQETATPAETDAVDADLRAGLDAAQQGAIAQYDAAGDDADRRAAALDSLDWRAKALGMVATQAASGRAMRRGAQQRQVKVRRIEQSDCCPACADLAGVYDPDDAAAWDCHPSCKADYEYVGGTADMSGLAAFATLKAKTRNAIPDEDFAGPNRTFPIPDQAHADNAASRVGAIADPDQRARIRARIRAICKRKGLKVPPSCEVGAGKTANHSLDDEETVDDVATFAGDAASGRYVEGEHAIYPHALIWRAGDYPDKQYAMDREDNLICAANFSDPAPINFAHTGLLQGRAGELRRVYVDEADPDVLRGEVAVPLWLDTHLTDADRNLSVGWNRQTKMPEHLSFVETARIAGAALFHATADMAGKGSTPPHRTYHGQMHVQDMHDTAVRGGAVCNPPATFASKGEHQFFQQAHDMSVANGAKCDAMTSEPRPIFSASTSPKEGSTMSVLANLFKRHGAELSAEDEKALDALEKPATFSVGDDPAFKALQDELAKERATRITAEATAFADALIGDGRATTGEREALIAKFTRATKDDIEHGTANFSGYGDTHSRVEELRKQEFARPDVHPKASAAASGERTVLGQHTSNPATFQGERQMTTEEEEADRQKRKAAALAKSPLAGILKD